MKIAFVTNYCPHYRVKTFETFSHYYDVDYYFYSLGDEWYWQQQHGVKSGAFRHEYLKGIRLGKMHISPSLPIKLLRNDFDVYIKCINGRFALPITYLVARLKRKPFILWTGIWSRIQTPAHRLFFPFTRYIYQHSDAIVVYGEHVKRYLISEGVSSERIFTTTHAVDNKLYGVEVNEERDSLLLSLGIEPSRDVILYLGRLEEGKGIEYLIEAYARLEKKDNYLIIVGTGSREDALKQLVKGKQLDGQIRFVGYVPTDQTIPYYTIASVFVLPSITTAVFKEPWGLVVNEAFNQGVPVVATDAVGAAAGGLVLDGETGYIVPEKDASSLAKSIDELLKDPSRRELMGRNAKKRVTHWNNVEMANGFRRAVEFVTR